MTVEEQFLQYLGDISTKMIDENSIYQKQKEGIEDQLKRYGLTMPEFGKIMAQLSASASQFMTQYSNASAIELVKLEENRPLLEAQIDLANKDIELKAQDILIKAEDIKIKQAELKIKEKDLLIKDKELEISEKKIELMTAQIEVAREEIKIKQQELILVRAKAALANAQAATETYHGPLLSAQAATERERAGLTRAQEALTTRQKAGYGDNMLVKAAEFEGGLASFAVNASPTNPTTGAAIQAFRGTINSVKSRAH